jgi:1-acyl-sn-glycerol-3-phosphate acyltransferase
MIFIVSLIVNIFQATARIASIFTNQGLHIEYRIRSLYSIFLVGAFAGLRHLPRFNIAGFDILQRYARERKSLVILSNHVSYADWVVLLALASQCGSMGGAAKIVTRDIVKSIPGIGWSTVLGRYPILSRSWDKDMATLADIIAQYNKENEMEIPSWIFIFPEGTFVDDTCDSRITKSKEFCRDNAIEPYTYVLCPRERGTNSIIANCEFPIIDITLSYDKPYATNNRLDDSSRKVPSISNFISAPYIDNISINIREIERDFAKQDKWLYKLFKEKEDILKQMREGGEYEKYHMKPDMIYKITAVGVSVAAVMPYLIPVGVIPYILGALTVSVLLGYTFAS